jgi:hypothetical protein
MPASVKLVAPILSFKASGKVFARRSVHKALELCALHLGGGLLASVEFIENF